MNTALYKLSLLVSFKYKRTKKLFRVAIILQMIVFTIVLVLLSFILNFKIFHFLNLFSEIWYVKVI